MSKVQFGLKNVYYAVVTEAGGTVTYGTPVALPGAVNLSLSPEGDETVFYADDSRYYVIAANSSYSGTLEVAMITDAFAKDVMGMIEDDNHLLVESKNFTPKTIALLFEVQGDVEARRFCLYHVEVSRSELAAATIEDSVTVQTATINIAASGATDTGYVKAYTTASTATADYNAWFTAVPTVVVTP